MPDNILDFLHIEKKNVNISFIYKVIDLCYLFEKEIIVGIINKIINFF